MSSSPDRPLFRHRVATLLGLLASEEGQGVLSRDVGRERIAFELARAWFDDVYIPSGRYLAGLKGDFSPAAAEQFEASFDPVELTAMERFHRFFELRIEMLPEHALDQQRIPIDERWRSVMRDAGYVLEDLGVDVERLRRRLAQDVAAAADVATLIHTGA